MPPITNVGVMASSVWPSAADLEVDHIGAQDAAGGGPVVDHQRLPEPLREVRAELARQDVAAAARRERHDHADRAAGIVLLSGKRGRRPHKHDSERNQSGKTPRCGVHGCPLFNSVAAPHVERKRRDLPALAPGRAT